MKKILRLVTTSVLTLTLVACGEASSSVSTSGTQTGSSVPSVSSAYANVTSVTLSAASNLLTQVLGSQQRVTVTASLNANTNPNLSLEWFVNGVKQAQTGRIFDFTPTAVGSFTISARLGNTVSNSLVVSASLPTLNVSSAKFVNGGMLEVQAIGGANVSLVGAKLDASSYYDIARGVYVLKLEEPINQGDSVTVRMEKAGLETRVQTVTFDSRELMVQNVVLESAEVLTGGSILPVSPALENGVYKVVKPLDAGTQFAKKVKINLDQKNMFGSLTPQTLTVATTVPAGAAAIPNQVSLVTRLDPREFEVNSQTVAGLYTININLGGKTVTTQIEVLAANPELVVPNKFSGAFYVDEVVTGSEIPFALNYQEASGVVRPALLGADGIYELVKPFETRAVVAADGADQKLSFDFILRNFPESEFLSNQFTVTLAGPSATLGANTSLSQGIEVKTAAVQTLNGNNLNVTNNFVTFSNGTASTTGGSSKTSHKATVTQFIDASTPVGVYTFTVTAGASGQGFTKDIKVRVVNPAPKIDFVMDAYNQVVASKFSPVVVATQHVQAASGGTAGVYDFTLNTNLVAGEVLNIAGKVLNVVASTSGQEGTPGGSTAGSTVAVKDTIALTIDEIITALTSHMPTGFTVSDGATKLILTQTSSTVAENIPSVTLANAQFDYGTRNYLIQENGDNFTIEKPVTGGNAVNLEWFFLLSNWQSTFQTDSIKLSNDNLELDPAKRNFFSKTSGTKTVANEVLLEIGKNHTLAYTFVGNTTAVAGETKTGFTFTAASQTITAGNNITIGTLVIDSTVVHGTTYTVTLTGATSVNGVTGTTIIFRAYNPNILEVGPSQIPASGASTYLNTNDSFNFVKMSMDTTGPDLNLFPKIPEFKLAVLMGANKDAMALVQQSAADITEARAREALDNLLNLETTLVDADYPSAVKDLFNRSALSITSTTAVGTYSLTMNVDGLSRRVNVNIVNPTPKIFVLTSIHGTTTASSSLFSDGKFSTSGENTNQIKYFDNTVSTNIANTDPKAHQVESADKFVQLLNGAYRIEMPAAATANKDGLFGQIIVADMPLGTYNFSIKKTYPDGKTKAHSDIVVLSDMNSFNLGTLASTNTNFAPEWIIAENGLELGEYVFEYSLGAQTLKVVVNVVDPTGLKINKLSIGNTESVKFNGLELFVVGSGITADLAQPLIVDFELEGNLTNDYFYQITKVNGTAFAELTLTANLDLVTGISAITVANGDYTGLTSSKVRIDETRRINLGQVHGTLVDTADLTVTLKFYERISWAEVLERGLSDRFVEVGTQQIKVLYRTLP